MTLDERLKEINEMIVLATRYLSIRKLYFFDGIVPKSIILSRPFIKFDNNDDTMLYIVQSIKGLKGNKRYNINQFTNIKNSLRDEAINLFPEYKNIEIMLVKE